MIDATQQNGNFEIYCEDVNQINNRICFGINIHGSTLSSNDQTGTSFLVTCGRNKAACEDSIITCAQGMNCGIDCHSKNLYPGSDGAFRTCRKANIIGPTDYMLTVQCDENNACQTAQIHGENSSKLIVTCRDTNGCCATSFYCPLNASQDDLCQIEGMYYLLYLENKYLIDS